MRDTHAAEPGPALVAFLDDECAALGIRRTTWARQHGISAANLTRWQDGATPRPDGFRQIAEALGRPLLEVYVAAGMLSEDEAQITVQSTPQPLADVDLAIARDPRLSAGERIALSGLRENLRAMRSGELSAASFSVPTELPNADQTGTVSITTRRGRRGKPRVGEE